MVTKTQSSTNSHHVNLCFSSRMLYVLVTFLILLYDKSVRINISVTILCMVNHTAVNERLTSYQNIQHQYASLNETDNPRGQLDLEHMTSHNGLVNNLTSWQGDAGHCGGNGNGSDDEEHREDGSFLWTKRQQSLILSAFYWGYVLFMMPCSMLIHRFGPVRVVAIGTLFSSLTCLAIPFMAPYGPEAVIVLRVFSGCLTGVYDPGTKISSSQWIPPNERARLCSLTSCGSVLGIFLTLVSSGYLCKYGFQDGWQSIFYIQGAFGVIVALLWWRLIYESPDSHPRISSIEKEYIQSRMVVNAVSSQRHAIPWKKLLTSMPVYAVVACNGILDLTFAMSTVFLPTYLADVMQFRVTSNGLISALPLVFVVIVQVNGGIFSDMLLNKTPLKTGTIRKLMLSIGAVTSAFTLIAVGFLDCTHSKIAVVLVVISFSSVGFAIVTYGTNSIDIAPQFSGIVSSMANLVSNSVAMGATLFISALISQNSDRETWQIIFTSVAGVILFFLVFFVCFASGEVQPWAIVPNSNKAEVMEMLASEINDADIRIEAEKPQENGHLLKC